MLRTIQIPIAISSGESEWYGIVRTASALIGLKSMAADLGRELRPRLHTDATAGKGIASRRGCGKVRHLETCTLWLQRYITEKKICINKVDGNSNIADLKTKHVDRATLWKLKLLGFYAAEGRSRIAKRATLSVGG